MKGLQDSIHDTTAHLFRHESGRMLAVLSNIFGLAQVEIAEDIVQETLLLALETWKYKGLPDNPRAWLYRAAKNKTIDFLRRERNFKANIAPNFLQETLRDAPQDQWLDAYFLDTEIEDAQLRMMFACCHPAIPLESQLALMLHTLCGLRVQEIAVAFMATEETIAKRLFRAKQKIKQEKLSLDVPHGRQLPTRLDAVLHAIYLLFNEGYKSASDAGVIRRELCAEALRLAGLLSRSKPGNVSQTHALQSLMCFHASRFDARLDEQGEIILLENQERRHWNQAFIAAGYEHLHQASVGNELCEYHLEAAIASYHASAPSFEQTNWKGIFYCYDLLYKINASPAVALNRAIALGYADGFGKGLEALKGISGLEKNYLYYAALGDFHAKNKEPDLALLAYQQALDLSRLPPEQRLMEGKIATLVFYTSRR